MARSHVTNREAQAVCDFAIDVLSLLHMPGWQVLVMEAPAEDDCHLAKFLSRTHTLKESWDGAHGKS